MSLVFDARSDVGTGPGFHALIVGVSAYRHLPAPHERPTPGGFGLRQLSTAAISAHRIYRWLTRQRHNLPVPLATIRFLASPSPLEQKAEPELGAPGVVTPATLDHMLLAAHDWRQDASTHRHNTTFFYCAGHGSRAERDEAILLLEGFGDGIGGVLRHAVSITNLFDGMAPTSSRPQMARTQFYFVDAGNSLLARKDVPVRQPPTTVFDIEIHRRDDRTAPIFYAAAPGSESMAYGRAGGLSLFSEALLRCLDGAAGEPTEDYRDGNPLWRVSVTSLSRALDRESETFEQSFGVDQEFALGGLVRDATICYLDGPPPIKSLVFDDRVALTGRPGLHALIVGVSSYPHLPGGPGRPARFTFGMRQLASPALTAYRIYQWLLDRRDHLPVPLATIRLLVSPSPTEVAAEPALKSSGDRSTVANLLAAATEWRTDASSHRDNVTLFSFAGHGVQRSKSDSVLLLENFGDDTGGTLRNAIDTETLFNGMAPSALYPHMARTQFYFVDACRIRPSLFKQYEWMNTTPIFNVELGTPDDRAAPIFFAAVPGKVAYGIAGEQTLFGRSLLACLNGAAATTTESDGRSQTVVSVYSLNSALQQEIAALNEATGAQQDYVLGGLVKDTIIVKQGEDEARSEPT